MLQAASGTSSQNERSRIAKCEVALELKQNLDRPHEELQQEEIQQEGGDLHEGHEGSSGSRAATSERLQGSLLPSASAIPLAPSLSFIWPLMSSDN